MDLPNYRHWQAQAPDTRPDIHLADGFLAGAVVSLEPMPDSHWVDAIMGPLPAQAASRDLIETRARKELRARLVQARAHMATPDPRYTPILAVTADGEFDLTAWSSGFYEAIASDLDMWQYLLAGQREGGLLALLGRHTVGKMGEAACPYIASHPEAQTLSEVAQRTWEVLSHLLCMMYEKRSQVVEGETPATGQSAAFRAGKKTMSVYRTLYVRTLVAVQERKLAVHDIACASALPEARIVSILEGEARDITLTELAGLCTALGMPPAALLRSA